MISKRDNFYNYILSNVSYEDKYNGDASSSVVGEHLGILKIILENLKLSSSEFFTTTASAGNKFNYYIKINDRQYLDIEMERGGTDKCVISLLNFQSNNIDKVGDIKMDLTQSLTSESIKNQFKIGIHYIENGTYNPEPADRFNFSRGSRGTRFTRRR